MMNYWVYILSNRRNTVLYVGMANDLEQRIFEHKIRANPGFASRYNCDKLVYYEEFESVLDCIKREKQLKKYRRAWKEELINAFNPNWDDLSKGWYNPKELAFGKGLKG